MQPKLVIKKTFFSFLIFLSGMLMGNMTSAQSKRIDIKEMKDTVSLLVSQVKSLEAETKPVKKSIDDVRTRLTVLVILNSIPHCGTWPSPSSKIELIEEYWKCIFDNTPYGKTFMLNY